MRIFRRLGDILTASLNDLVDRCEDPAAMLRQAIRELESHVEASLTSAVEVVATEKLLAKQLSEEQAASEHWRKAATEALGTSDDARAREALERALEHDDVALALQDQWKRTSQQARRLKTRTAALQAKLAEAHRRQQVLAARERVARAERLVGAAGRAPLAGLARLDERLNRAEALADAREEIATDCWADDLLNQGRRRRVDAALEALKATNV